MSFTTKIKNELVELTLTETEKLALLSGFFRNNKDQEEDIVYISNENENVILYIEELLKSFGKVNYKVESREGSNFREHKLYILYIMKGLSFLRDTLSLDKEVPDNDLVGEVEEIKSYLRGVFLSSGSINDPKTSRYHLEITIKHPSEAIFVQKLLNLFDLNAKLLAREKGYMVYMKEADAISDFLRLIDAIRAVLYFEDIRVLRETKNKTNRLNNCEQANMDKIVESAAQQLKYIEILKENLAVNLLDDKTKEALIYREKYQEASLKELSEIISLETGKKITKSGLNHRFRKIKELATKFIEEKK